MKELYDAVLEYFNKHNTWPNQAPTIQEAVYPSYAMIEKSSYVQKVLETLPKEEQTTHLQSTLESLVKEGLLDDKKFDGGYYYIHRPGIGAYNFMAAVHDNDY